MLARVDAVVDKPDVCAEGEKKDVSVACHSEAGERAWTSAQEKEFLKIIFAGFVFLNI